MFDEERLVGVVSVLLLATYGTAAAPAAARTPVGEYAHKAFVTTNENRDDAGLTPLAHDRCLQRAATRQAKRMAARGEMFHQALGGLMRRCGLREAAENVAYGFESGESVVDEGWMRSPEHRENILRPSYTRLAVGAHLDEDGSWYVSELFGRR